MVEILRLTDDITILQGDVRESLRTLPDESVQCVVTSPPYWGLRDYGVPGQIGLESSLEQYLATMVDVFRDIWRVLRKKGTLWLNEGDCYTSGGRSYYDSDDKLQARQVDARPDTPRGLKPKDLVGVPWRLAFALQADGWYLRSDIIWAKPNPMPESVTDRPTKAHEYLFLFTKSEQYYYDADAIREPHAEVSIKRAQPHRTPAGKAERNGDVVRPGMNPNTLDLAQALHPGGRNKRTVWEIATESYPEAHFATFPRKLVEPCILAGSSPKACPVCGEPWKRVTEVTYNNPGNRTTNGPRSIERRHETAGFPVRLEKEVTTIGWEPTCQCEGNDGSGRCLILDPFNGSGTTGLVAIENGRAYVGCELNPDYVTLTRKRLQNGQTRLAL